MSEGITIDEHPNENENSVVIQEPSDVTPQAPSDLEIDDIVEETQVVEPETKEEKKENDEFTAPVRREHFVVVDEEWSSPRDPEYDSEELSLPDDLRGHVVANVRNFPVLDMANTPQAKDVWAPAVQDSLTHQSYEELYEDSLAREGSSWKQGVDVNNGRYGGAIPKVKPREGQDLQGERAVIQAMRHIGLGTQFTEAMWHSGIWITFKAPTDTEIIELNRQLFADKIQFGRYTHGLAFSNVSSFMIDRVVNFALDHVYTTTLEDHPGKINSRGLKDVLLSQDIPTLLTGFLSSMYAKGFNYRRACTADPEKCMHVIEEVVNISKLVFVDNNALTERQKVFMMNRQSRCRTMKEVKDYQSESLRQAKRVIKLREGTQHEFKMTIKSPTISEYVEAGYKWIDGITQLVEQALVNESSPDAREHYVQVHGQATFMRQYSHFVECISLPGGDITDKESVEKTLGVLSSDDAVRNKFTEEVIKYINDSTISIVGIPVFDCPVCGKEQVEEHGFKKFKNIIPLDVLQSFFGLVTQRVAKITER